MGLVRRWCGGPGGGGWAEASVEALGREKAWMDLLNVN